CARWGYEDDYGSYSFDYW
nr:immunoglobulin heavy chain junction region [Macaca mulatta]MOX92807.1 immunoglobulin heavy chain junction region [Macaca mulatta]MOX93134.1 immunoglobulin heavy chain junction region [Macaca mulatta]MOX93377.1 immunoglobulin heavy chain junction region [Macaca mulatta]MOX93859.1 immunoglobulin heavy chain junction region [Macaca mulatta]